MQKQYIYPQNMRTQAKLWFWNLKDVIILAIALTISVVSWAKLGFILPLHPDGRVFGAGFYQARMAGLCFHTAIFQLEGARRWLNENNPPPS